MSETRTVEVIGQGAGKVVAEVMLETLDVSEEMLTMTDAHCIGVYRCREEV